TKDAKNLLKGISIVSVHTVKTRISTVKMLRLKKRGRKPESSGIIEAPYSCETVVSFIGQGQMPDDQNTTSINSHEPSFITTEALVNQAPTGSSHTYNHIAIIPSFGLTDAFIGNVQMLNEQNTASVNPHESFFEIAEQTLDDQDPTLTNSYESLLELLENLLAKDKQFIGQEPAQNHQPINTYETTTSNLEASYAYNNITNFPFFGTSDVFIVQGQTLDDQNTASIINQVSIPITTSITPYKATTEEFESLHSNFETPYISNHILPSEAAGAFIELEYRQYTTPISAYETTTEEFQSHYFFGSIEAIIGQGQMSGN
ncbi:43822_t:CDS:2, partial [Gigaspora margarita]